MVVYTNRSQHTQTPVHPPLAPLTNPGYRDTILPTYLDSLGISPNSVSRLAVTPGWRLAKQRPAQGGESMKIAVDAMGGDHAPAEIVRGAVAGSRQFGVDILLVGPKDQLERELASTDLAGASLEIVHTDQWLAEGEHPGYALRQKRQASVFVAARLVKEGKADAMLSAGPTGGVTVAAMMLLGTIEEMSRPVVGGPFLGFAPETVLLDLGANVDCQPYQLVDFAIIGAVYAEKMMGISHPTVAILSVGAEEGKGNQQVLEAYSLLKQSGLNFIGNVEGYDIPLGRANVIVCDGFVGNILVKFTENLGKTTCRWLQERLAGKLAADELEVLTGELLRQTSAADATGGGPLWAVDGVVCVAHGRSRAPEIAMTVGQARAAVEKDLVGAFKRELAAARQRLGRPEGQPPGPPAAP